MVFTEDAPPVKLFSSSYSITASRTEYITKATVNVSGPGDLVFFSPVPGTACDTNVVTIAGNATSSLSFIEATEFSFRYTVDTATACLQGVYFSSTAQSDADR